MSKLNRYVPCFLNFCIGVHTIPTLISPTAVKSLLYLYLFEATSHNPGRGQLQALSLVPVSARGVPNTLAPTYPANVILTTYLSQKLHIILSTCSASTLCYFYR